MKTATLEMLRMDRATKADQAKRAINELRRRLDRMEATIDAGEAGEPIRTDELVPFHQYVAEVQTFGAEYRTLWTAIGLLQREEG